ncbi:MAG: DUF4861 family protein [Paludibacteraceae bacterium]|nr:DUF4861 family protein [Paludibacteraceae bacterium]
MRKYLYILIVLLTFVGCHKDSTQPKVYGRYVPERKDDFAWENEYAAFRMYGPALRPENPSNGVDLWLKASPELVVDSFYYREHVLGLPYHINYGKGLDCYKVGHTCGAGGLVVIANGKTYVGGAYDRWEILKQTSRKLVFRLEYDSLLIDGHLFKEQITITAEAGKILNKAEVVLTACDEQETDLPSLLAGGGIYMHDTIDQYDILNKFDAVIYSEDAQSDRTAAQMNYDYNGSTSQGRIYLAVHMQDAFMLGTEEGNIVAVSAYEPGSTLTYYFGAGWSEYQGAKSFPSLESWKEAIETEISEL